MKPKAETSESGEHSALSTPEKRLNTFDDLHSSAPQGDHVRTFDDIAANRHAEKGLNTFDDLSRQAGDSVPQGDAGTDSIEVREHQRITAASDEIRNQEWMQPDKWRTLSTDEKRIALEHSGRALGRAYRTPEPPLTTKKDASEAQGEFGDGYSYDLRKKSLTGSDYGIRMNEEGITERDKRLFGDDPGEALRTYGHEFRHSYQAEQAHAYDKNFQVDDPVKAREWSENMKNYIEPPHSDLAKADPDRYFREYEAYRNQPVERDAREFGDRLVTQVYSPKRQEEYEG